MLGRFAADVSLSQRKLDEEESTQRLWNIMVRSSEIQKEKPRQLNTL